MLVVRSNKLLAIGTWQPIRIGVSGRKVMLSVDGIVNSGLLQTGEIIPLTGASIYIGTLMLYILGSLFLTELNSAWMHAPLIFINIFNKNT